MKKRLLSLLLAVLMTASAFALVLPVASAEPAELTEDDYNSLYVQKGLLFAVDFFKNNASWNGSTEASANLADYVWTKTPTSIGVAAGSSYNVSAGYLSLDSLPQATAIKGTEGLLSDPKGMTYEMVATFAGQTSIEKLIAGGVAFPTTPKEGETGLFFNGVRLECEVDHPLLRDGAANGPVLSFSYPGAFSGINTVVISMRSDGILETTSVLPELADSLYLPSGGTTLKGQRFYITAEEYTDAEGTTGVKMLANQSSWRRFANCKPITVTTDKVWDEATGAFVVGEEKTYVVGYEERSNTNEGITDAYPFYTPGYLGFFSNGQTVFEKSDVQFPTNTFYYGATYLKKWANPGVNMYAARVYNRVLSEAERDVNHLADLAKYFKLDISNYAKLTEKDREVIAVLFRDYDYTADPAALNTLLTTEANKILYDGLLEGIDESTAAYAPAAAFVVTAKEYSLDVAGIRMLPAAHRTAVYATVNSYAGSKTTAALNALIRSSIDEILRTQYGDYLTQSDYDYRELYVRQDDLEFAVDFFDAKATDGNVYCGPSYDTWKTEYDYAYKNWQSMTDAEGKPFASRNAALQYVYENRVETPHESNWGEMTAKYVWKGDPAVFSTIAGGGSTYVYDNIRSYGDGKLICLSNNSIKIAYTDLDDDISYQVVAKGSGSPEWQLGTFRLEMGASGTAVSLNTLRYKSFFVTGTADSPVLNEKYLQYYKIKTAIPSLYSADLTVSVKRTAGDVGHYYNYTYNESTGAYDVVEVPAGAANANAGPILYYGMMDLSIYGNGSSVLNVPGLPYTDKTPDAIGNWGGYEYYAIRIYSAALTAEEIAQNHFADLAGYYDLDLTQYFALSDEDRATLHTALNDLQLGTPALEAIDTFEAAMSAICYSFVPDTEEGTTFRAIAEENFLNTASMRSLSPWAQNEIITRFASNPAYTSQSWYPAILQSELEAIVSATLRDHYGESMVHRLTSFAGYQLKKAGDPGMRGVFSLDVDMIEDVLSKIDGADLTLGVMLLPAGSVGATVTVEGGEIILPDEVLASAVAYENGDYTEEVFRLDGKQMIGCEYFPEDYDEGVVYVAYAAIMADGKEPILYHTVTSASFEGAGGLSIYELSRYAKAKFGMTYEAIQTLLNEANEDDKIVLTVGNANICDYVVVRSGLNATAVDALQELIYNKVGIRLTEVRPDAAADYAHVIMLGEECDVVYTDKALYGLTLGSTTLNIWYLDQDNASAALAIFDDYLDIAYEGDGVASILIGTDIVRRAH